MVYSWNMHWNMFGNMIEKPSVWERRRPVGKGNRLRAVYGAVVRYARLGNGLHPPRRPNWASRPHWCRPTTSNLRALHLLTLRPLRSSKSGPVSDPSLRDSLCPPIGPSFASSSCSLLFNLRRNTLGGFVDSFSSGSIQLVRAPRKLVSDITRHFRGCRQFLCLYLRLSIRREWVRLRGSQSSAVATIPLHARVSSVPDHCRRGAVSLVQRSRSRVFKLFLFKLCIAFMQKRIFIASQRRTCPTSSPSPISTCPHM